MRRRPFASNIWLLINPAAFSIARCAFLGGISG
jgi:hypothetical protein